MQTKQMMTVDDVRDELSISNFEVRRAIAQGNLKASIVNPDAISGPKAKRPDYRIKRANFEAFVDNMAGVRLREGFFNQSGDWFRGINTNNRMFSAMRQFLGEITESAWLRYGRAAMEAENLRRPGLVREVVVDLGLAPQSVMEAAGEFVSTGMAGAFERRAGRPGSEMTVGEATIINAALKEMKSQVEQEFGRSLGIVGQSMSITQLERVYWTRPVYLKLVKATRAAIVNGRLEVRNKIVTLEAEEGHYRFSATASMPYRKMLDFATIGRIVEGIF